MKPESCQSHTNILLETRTYLYDNYFKFQNKTKQNVFNPCVVLVQVVMTGGTLLSMALALT